MEIFLKLFLTIILAQCCSVNCEAPSKATCPELIENLSKFANCSCMQTRELDAKPNIICDETTDPQMLKDLFRIMAALLPEDSRSLGKLSITNDVEFDIEEGYFGTITFEEIHFGTNKKACKVTKIHPNAFNGPIGETAKIFHLRSEAIGHNGDLFKSLFKLKNLRDITIEGKYLTHIPRVAFCENVKSAQSSYPFLESIRFHTTDMNGLIFARSVGPRAFWNLPSLKTVSIESQDLRKVGVRAFGLPESAKTEQTLKIDLSYQWNENFTSDSFLPATFADLNRPVELNLYGNPKIYYLPEESFRKFLEQDPRNRIKLGQIMDCDCRMNWLYQNKQFKRQFLPWSFEDPNEDKHLVECRDNGLLWDMKKEHFAKCLGSSFMEEPIKEEL